jgi:hypothetical protein
MANIESAIWGDERSTKNVTAVLRDRVEGDRLSINKVDDSLIPAFTVAPRAELSPEDVKIVREKAVKACGAADQACVALRTSEFTQELLRTKANNEITEGSADLVKGKRLTIVIRDKNGKRQKKVVPENGKLELDGLLAADPRKSGEVFPSSDFITKKFFEYSQVSISTFLWVFSVVATYTLFNQMNWGYAAPVLALIAFLVPGSGYAIILIFFALRSFLDNYTGTM